MTIRNNFNKNILFKYLDKIRKLGFIEANKQGFLLILRRLGFRSHDLLHKRRIEISKKVDKILGSTVRYGPFKGLKLSSKTWWGGADKAAMLLGIYEKEVLNSLTNIPKNYKTFIDIGAADGYYGIGVLVNNLFNKSICYEASLAGQKIIKYNARLNNVLSRVEVKGIAKNNFYSELPVNILSTSLLFMDIEGNEFELADKKMFKAFRNSIIIIELHEWFYEDGEKKLQKLLDDSATTHTFSIFTMGSRDLSHFSELKKFHDNERWLICSEGRQQLMSWLRFDPK
jgi:hypothetical protein